MHHSFIHGLLFCYSSSILYRYSRTDCTVFRFYDDMMMMDVCILSVFVYLYLYFAYLSKINKENRQHAHAHTSECNVTI